MSSRDVGSCPSAPYIFQNQTCLGVDGKDINLENSRSESNTGEDKQQATLYRERVCVPFAAICVLLKKYWSLSGILCIIYVQEKYASISILLLA